MSATLPQADTSPSLSTLAADRLHCELCGDDVTHCAGDCQPVDVAGASGQLMACPSCVAHATAVGGIEVDPDEHELARG